MSINIGSFILYIYISLPLFIIINIISQIIFIFKISDYISALYKKPVPLLSWLFLVTALLFHMLLGRVGLGKVYYILE